MADGEARFSYGLIITAVVLMVGMPFCINLLAPQSADIDERVEYLNESYYNFVGSHPVKEDVWALQGIYTSYQDGGPRGWTDDNWVYGTKIYNYTPEQYKEGPNAYTVTCRTVNDGTVEDLNVYQYSSVGAGNSGIKEGDIYTNVSLDSSQKSNIFFTPESKHTDGYRFWYDYSGYRYAFSPIETITTVDNNGEAHTWVNQKSTCSIIWYQYYNVSQGLCGQLVVNAGQDYGLAYITSETIINNFNSANSTAKHVLQFNGVSLNLYIRMDPYYMASSGMSIQECFDNGYWSIMITSDTADVSGYTATDYSFNPNAIFETIIDLFTFNLDGYGFSPMVGMICSLVVILPLYVGLITIGLHNYKVLLIAGLLLCVQAIVSLCTGFFEDLVSAIDSIGLILNGLI